MADFIFEEHKGLLVGKIDGKRYERVNVSENGTTIPPARIITDSEGGMWTFGTEYAQYAHNGEYEFNVLRNDVDTDEVAKRIVMERGVVTIYGSYGRKRWSRSRRHFI